MVGKPSCNAAAERHSWVIGDLAMITQKKKKKLAKTLWALLQPTVDLKGITETSKNGFIMETLTDLKAEQ